MICFPFCQSGTRSTACRHQYSVQAVRCSSSGTRVHYCQMQPGHARLCQDMPGYAVIQSPASPANPHGVQVWAPDLQK